MSDEQLQHVRHTAAHLLAAAVKDLWPGTHNAIGPAIAEGFYQDFDFGDHKISEADFPRIETRMRELLAAWGPFSEREVTVDEARKLFAANPYKLELIEEFAKDGRTITVNDPGNFLDLCKGGHADDASKTLQHFKLLSIAGAYWRGDEQKQMLTRIYGTVFPTPQELDAHLKLREQVKLRDHRKLGQQLDLFTFSPLVGSGLPLFTPRGTIIRQELEKFLFSIQEPKGYQRVDIPHLAKPALYHTSGHWDKFAENLFHVTGRDGEEFVVKPMNCPHHTQIYAARPRSYRDLPLRLAEITKVYRDEQAGELLGLARVRSITQDDAHIFCRPDQIREQVTEVIDIVQEFYAAFDFQLDVHLSVRGDDHSKYLGDDELWRVAEEELKIAAKESGFDFVIDPDEAAFYGPKIDFVAVDSLKRRWQLATIQLDFNMPQRFDLSYTQSDGTAGQPVMIHRAIMGALERFMAILLEHYNGHLPLWLAPTQVSVLPIADDQHEYAATIVAQLRTQGIRVDLNDRSISIGKKIREAQQFKVPVMFIIGKRELADSTVAVRTQAADLGAKSVAEVISTLQQIISERRPTLEM